MTNTEFSNEFDILYNSIATNSAPSIDLYEKSVYLTKAQEQFIKNHFHPLGNKYKEGFENSTKRRYDLSELIKGYNSEFIEQIHNNFEQYSLTEDSQFFKIPDKVFLIVQESAVIRSNDKCIDGKTVSVVPETYDEFNTIIKNPFKKPYKKKVARLDFSSNGLDFKIVELINPYYIEKYKVRYLNYPSPIILIDLESEFPDEGLSIRGSNQETPCKLNEGTHDEILDRAVELALADYKPELLNVKTQINNRNE